MESDQLDGRSADGYTPPHMESDQLESSRNLDPVAGATDGSPTQQQELLMDDEVKPPRKATQEEPLTRPAHPTTPGTPV